MASHYSDPELLADLRSAVERRVDRALKYLYAECRDSLSQFVRLNGGTNEAAADVLQEAVILAREKVLNGTFAGRSKLTSFVIGIGRFKWRELCRKSGRQVPSTDELLDLAAEPDEEDPVFNADNVILLTRAMRQINEACRKLLTLFYYESMTMKEIAVKMKFKNDDVAKTKKHKCLDRLQSIFKRFSID